jgi:Lar family restriction alleviation protein
MNLNKCPFCGYYHPRLECDDVCGFYFYVCCPICGARTRSEYTEEAAASNWNKRA